MAGYIARVDTEVEASPEQVWDVITTRATDVMFGSEVVSDWTVGSPIVWRGEWEGKPFEDHGEIVEMSAPSRLVMTHFSPLSGDDDVPENYHTLTYRIERWGDGSRVVFEQDGNRTQEAADHAAGNWAGMLGQVKKLAEQ